MIYNNPGIVEYGEFNTKTLLLLNEPLRYLQNPGIVEYGDFNTEKRPLLKVKLRDLQ